MKSPFNKPPKQEVFIRPEIFVFQKQGIFDVELKKLAEEYFLSLLDESTQNDCVMKLDNLANRYETEILKETANSIADSKTKNNRNPLLKLGHILLNNKNINISRENINNLSNNISEQVDRFKEKINNVILFIEEKRKDENFIKSILIINSKLLDIKNNINSSKNNIIQNVFNYKMEKEYYFFVYLLNEKLWLDYYKYLIVKSSQSHYDEVKLDLVKILTRDLNEANEKQISLRSYLTGLNGTENFRKSSEEVKSKWKGVVSEIVEMGRKIIEEYDKFNTIENIEEMRASSQRKTFNGALGIPDTEIKKTNDFQHLSENTGLYQLMQELDRLKSNGDLEEEEYDNIKTSIEELIKKPQLFTLQNIFDSTVNIKLKDKNGNEIKDKDGNMKLQDTSLSILKYVLIDLKERDMDTFNKLKKVVIEFTDYTIKEIKHPDFNHKKFAEFLTEIETGLSYSNKYDGGRLVIHKVFDFFEKLEQDEKEIYLGSFIKAIKSIVLGGDNNNIHTLSDIVNILVQEHILKSIDEEKQAKESSTKDIEALHTFLNSEQREEIKGILNKIPYNYGIWKTISESLQTIISKHNKKSFEKRHKAVTAEISLNRVRIGGSSEKSQNGDTVKSIGYDKKVGEQGDNK